MRGLGNATGVDGDQTDNSAALAGAVYVFVRTAGTWSQQAYLKASNPEASDQFVFAIAIAGDTLVVGAWGEDSNATGMDGDQADNSAALAGAAWVFKRAVGVWSPQFYVKATNTEAGAGLGASVSVSGDTIVVGSLLENGAAKAVAGGVTTRYILSGPEVVDEYDGADVWQARYIYEDGIDEPRAMDRADLADVDGDANVAEILRFHYHQNALDGVSELTQPTGAVVEWVTYDVYGKAAVRDKNGVLGTASYVGNPYLYTGREW